MVVAAAAAVVVVVLVAVSGSGRSGYRGRNSGGNDSRRSSDRRGVNFARFKMVYVVPFTF